MKTILIRFTVFAVLFCGACIAAYAEYDAHAFSKWLDGKCNTTFTIVTTGDAGPFTIEVMHNGESVYFEEGLPSDTKLLSLDLSGSFTVRFTDAFGCTSEMRLEVICECEELEHNITNSACHKSDGVLELTPPNGGLITDINWISWPQGTTSPANTGIVFGNLVPGKYTAAISLEFLDPSTGAFTSCQFEKSFDLSECTCEFELINTEQIDFTPPLDCYDPNGSITIPSFRRKNIYSNHKGNVFDFYHYWQDPAGTVLQSGKDFDLTDIQAGEYTLTVVDDAGCKATNTYSLTDGFDFISDIEVTHPCYGSNGRILIDGAFQYTNFFVSNNIEVEWSDGSTAMVRENLNAGTYRVSITDLETGCIYEQTFDLQFEDHSDIALRARQGCEDGLDGVIISVDNLRPDIEYTYEWSTGENTVEVFASTDDTYHVTVTDHWGCEHTVSKEFTILRTEYETYMAESTVANACNGVIAARVVGYGGPFQLTLFDSGDNQLYQTTYDEYVDGIFNFPTPACPGDYYVNVSNNINCIKRLPISVHSDECDFGFHFENVDLDDDGFATFEVVIEGPVTDPSNYKYELYHIENTHWTPCGTSHGGLWDLNHATGELYWNLGSNNSSWKLLSTQSGNPVFPTFWPDISSCAYKVVVSSIYDPTCSVTEDFFPISCDRRHLTFEDIQVFVNQEIAYPILGSVTLSFDCNYWWDHGIDWHVSLTGPTGEVDPHFSHYTRKTVDHLQYHDFLEQVTFADLSTPGEYCFTLSDHCDYEEEFCVEVESCPSVMAFYEKDALPVDEVEHINPLHYTSLFPTLRDKPSNHQLYEDAYVGNGVCIDDCFSLDQSYVENCGGSADISSAFYYEPHDHADPCGGGTVSLYIYDYESFPTRAAVLVDQYEVTTEAVHEFIWENSQQAFSGDTDRNTADFAYSGFNKEIDEFGFGMAAYGRMSNGLWRNKYICESGAYCLFDSEDIFDDISTDKYLLFTSCENWTSICNIWPDSKECQDLDCSEIICPEYEFLCEGACPTCDDGVQNGGELDIDCGGPNCEPCSNCTNFTQDGNEQGIDCGPTCPCDCSCNNGILDGCETDVDCGGICLPCPGTGGGGGGSGTDDGPECQFPWDCPEIGYHCLEGECVPIQCPDEPCPAGQECDENGNCVIYCSPDEEWVCPIGTICEDGLCVPDDSYEPTDESSSIYGELCDFYDAEWGDEDDPIVNREYILDHNLEAGSEISYDFTRHAGLQITVWQGSSLLGYAGCGTEGGPFLNANDEPLDNLVLESNAPLRVEIRPYEFDNPDELCGPRVKHKFELELNCLDDGLLDPFGDCNSLYVSNDPNEVNNVSHSILSDGGNGTASGSMPVVILSPVSSSFGSVSEMYIDANSEEEFIVAAKLYSKVPTASVQEVIHYQSFDVGESSIGGLLTQAGYVQDVTTNTKYTRFAKPFATVPVVLPTQVGKKTSTDASIRISNVTRYGFKILMQQENSTGSPKEGETISYVAMEQGTGSIDGRTIIVGSTGTKVNDRSYYLTFEDSKRNQGSFTSAPYFFGFPQTANGNDLGILTYDNLDSEGVMLSLLESQLYDQEVAHPDQDVGYILIEKSPECECEKPIEELEKEVVQPTCGLADGSISFSIIGGVSEPYLISINGNESVYYSSHVSYDNLTEGKYIISVQDTFGCAFVDTIDLIASQLSLDNYLVENINCENEFYNVNLDILGGTPPFSYSWSNGTAASSLADVSQGHYYVTVVDAEGCIGTHHFDLRAPYGWISKTDESCGLSNGTLTANPLGIAPFTYVWSTGETSRSIADLSSGIYDLTVTDAAGCQTTKSQTINPDAQFDIDFAHPFCGADNGYAEIIVEGTAPISYIWSTNATTNRISNLSEGTYYVTATDASGCVSEGEVTLANTNSVSLGGSGGNEGFSDGRFIPGGTVLDWSFDPKSVSDQLIISAQNVTIVNTGATTRMESSCCNTYNCCSDLFLGDYQGDFINLLVGSGYVNEGTTIGSGCHYAGWLEGEFYVSEDSYITVEVIGSNCGGSTGWSVALSCNGSSNQLIANIDEGNMEPPLEVLSDSEIELPNRTTISLFPNPASSTLYIEVPLYLVGSTMDVFTTTGNQVFSKTIAVEREELVLDDYISGVYILQINTPTGIVTNKFIVSK